jgi:DNA polymerase III sliding clamp (beta) subunit (PCNA family)
MKLYRIDLIRAMEIALGPAELEHERSPDVAFLPSSDGLVLRGQTGEGAGWDALPADERFGEGFAAPGRPILSTLKEIRDEHVELSRQAQELHLVAGAYRAVLWTRSAALPPVPQSAPQRVEMATNLVGRLGALVAYARPKGRTKSVFPGVHLLLGPAGLRIVATDGRRLAMAASSEIVHEHELSAILPGRFLLLASRFLEHDAPAVLTLGGGMLALVQGPRGVAGTVLAGPMPSYKALLPGGAQHRGRVRRQRVTEAVRQARLFSSRVLVQLDEDKLYLSTAESSEGMAEISLGLEWGGPLYRAQLNTDELLEALENLPGDELQIELQGERAPMVLRSEAGAIATLMPLLW